MNSHTKVYYHPALCIIIWIVLFAYRFCGQAFLRPRLWSTSQVWPLMVESNGEHRAISALFISYHLFVYKAIVSLSLFSSLRDQKSRSLQSRERLDYDSKNTNVLALIIPIYSRLFLPFPRHLELFSVKSYTIPLIMSISIKLSHNHGYNMNHFKDEVGKYQTYQRK